MDTCMLSKNLFPDLRKHNLEFLVKHFLGKPYDAHNALEDARILQELFNSWQPSPEDISMVTYPASDFM